MLGKFKILMSVSCVTIFLIVSCNSKNKGEWIVSDISRDTLLIAETSVHSPNVLFLEISGQTDDSIEVRSLRLPGGIVRQKLRVDHYSPKISVKVRPYKATKGAIKIKYYLP